MNLRATFQKSDEYTRVAIVALFGSTLLAIISSIFFSPQIVFTILLGVIVIFASFFRPTLVLGFLLFYLPFEPFLLKWVGDGAYIYVKYGSELIIYLLVVCVIWKRISGQIRFKQSPLDIPFLLLVLLCIVSALVNWLPIMTAMLGIRQIIRFIFLFFITLNLDVSSRWIRNVLFGLFGVLALQVFLGYMQTLFGGTLDSFLLPSVVRTFGDIQVSGGTEQFWDPGQRIFGTLGRYDILGTFMAFFMLMLVSILYEPKLVKYRKILSVLLAVSIPALALTYSRSAWFGFVLGFLFISLWAKKDKRVLIGAIVGVSIIVLYLTFSGLVVDRLLEVSGQNITERFFEAFSYERWRSEYYGLGRLYWIVQTIFAVIPSAPLFGHGPAMYGGGAVAALGDSSVYDSLGLPFGVYGTGGYIDNNWFSLWGEIGTIGLLSYLWMYGIVFWTGIKTWRKSQKPFTRALSLAVAATTIAIALNAFLATFLEVRTLAPYLWVMAAIVILLSQREKIE